MQTGDRVASMDGARCIVQSRHGTGVKAARKPPRLFKVYNAKLAQCCKVRRHQGNIVSANLLVADVRSASGFCVAAYVARKRLSLGPWMRVLQALGSAVQRYKLRRSADGVLKPVDLIRQSVSPKADQCCPVLHTGDSLDR